METIKTILIFFNTLVCLFLLYCKYKGDLIPKWIYFRFCYVYEKSFKKGKKLEWQIWQYKYPLGGSNHGRLIFKIKL